ncbi:hypothetical protein ABPG72_011445 [Tetrahymena utriculariae]
MKSIFQSERYICKFNNLIFKYSLEKQLFKKQSKLSTCAYNIKKDNIPRFCFSNIRNIKQYSDIPSNANQNNQNEEVKVNDQKELLLSGGGCAISYQAGYMHGLSEFIPKKFLKQYRVGGVSSGSCIASFFVCSVYSDKDMKYWYEKYIRENLKQINKQILGPFNATKYVKEQAIQAYIEAQSLKVPFNGTLHLYISPRKYVLGFTKQLIDNFTDPQQFGESISCSCAIPFVTTGRFSDFYQGISAIDGGFTMALPFRNQDSDCIFLNVLPKICSEFPVVRERPDFLSVIHIDPDEYLKFPKDYFNFSYEIADEYFLRGYLSSHKQKQKLLRAFKML